MPRDSNGTYSLPPGTIVNTGDTVLPSQHNPPFNDVASALTGSLARNGTGGMLANLPMNGFRATGLGDGANPQDAATVAQLNAASIPVGTPFPWLTNTAPPGYIFAFGQNVSRATYAELFAVWGTFFGAGDGSSTFGMPDFRGVALIGLDNMGGTAANRVSAATTIGGVTGNQSVALDVSHMPSHNHGGATSGAGGHSHGVNHFLGSPSGGQQGAPVDFGTLGGGVPTTFVGDHAHGIPAQGGGVAHPNVQPSFPLNIMIFTGVI